MYIYSFCFFTLALFKVFHFTCFTLLSYFISYISFSPIFELSMRILCSTTAIITPLPLLAQMSAFISDEGRELTCVAHDTQHTALEVAIRQGSEIYVSAEVHCM